jgi:hypothetical protein
MEVVVVILLAAVILAVVIDMAMRMERRSRPADPLLSTTQKIIVDLKRRR